MLGQQRKVSITVYSTLNTENSFHLCQKHANTSKIEARILRIVDVCMTAESVRTISLIS